MFLEWLFSSCQGLQLHSNGISSLAHRVFNYNSFIETGRSVILTRWRFWNQFNLGHHGRVPCRNTIMKWVKSFQRTGCLRPGTARRRDRTVRTPENIEKMRQVVEPALVIRRCVMHVPFKCQIGQFAESHTRTFFSIHLKLWSSKNCYKTTS